MRKLEFKPQDRQSIDFAEKERQKSKNLFNYKDYLNLVSCYEYKNTAGYHVRKIQLQPNTAYTISFPTKAQTDVVLLLHVNEGVNASGYLDTRKTTDTKTFVTDDTGCLYIGVVGSNDSSVNSLLTSLHLQIEEGRVATDCQSYCGGITRNGDSPIIFADREMQKSKNLLQVTLENFNLENKDYSKAIYKKERDVKYPLYFYVQGDVAYPNSPSGALFAFDYADGTTSYLTGVGFRPGEQNDTWHKFDGSKDLICIRLINWSKNVGTFNFAQLEENDHFTGYEKYNGTTERNTTIFDITHTGLDLGYSAGVAGDLGTTIASDFTKYKKVIATVCTENIGTNKYSSAFSFELDLTKKTSSGGEPYRTIASPLNPYISMSTTGTTQLIVAVLEIGENKNYFTFKAYSKNGEGVAVTSYPNTKLMKLVGVC